MLEDAHCTDTSSPSLKGPDSCKPESSEKKKKIHNIYIQILGWLQIDPYGIPKKTLFIILQPLCIRTWRFRTNIVGTYSPAINILGDLGAYNRVIITLSPQVGSLDPF